MPVHFICTGCNAISHRYIILHYSKKKKSVKVPNELKKNLKVKLKLKIRSKLNSETQENKIQ